MSNPRFVPISIAMVVLSLLTGAGAKQLLAHCDGLDGPVVNAAKNALDSENINLALIWVQAEDEMEVRTVFEQSLAVRKLSKSAAALADRHFFETLVRLHRSGEGAAYTGLKPAGRDLGPAIPAADQAVVTGSIDHLEDLVIAEIRRGMQAHFSEVKKRRSYDPNNLRAGRDYVRAYVEFIHYIERLHESASEVATGHYSEISH